MKLASSTALALITSVSLLFPLQGAVFNLAVISTLSSSNAPALGLVNMATQSKKTTNQATKKLKITSSQQAIQLVKRQYSGKVLRVQSSRVKGNSGYRVKLLSSAGAVFYVSVDAKTGNVRRN